MADLRPHQERAMACEWRAVVGCEGFYEVSSDGRVRSCARSVNGRAYRPVVLRPYGDRPRVNLAMAGRHKTRLVSHLVAEAFIGPRPPGHEVAHWDGNPSRNVVGNLRYATSAENSADAKRHGTTLVGERNHRAKLLARDVRRIRALAGKATQREIAEEFGISQGHVSEIVNAKTWGHL